MNKKSISIEIFICKFQNFLNKFQSPLVLKKCSPPEKNPGYAHEPQSPFWDLEADLSLFYIQFHKTDVQFENHESQFVGIVICCRPKPGRWTDWIVNLQLEKCCSQRKHSSVKMMKIKERMEQNQKWQNFMELIVFPKLSNFLLFKN